jgi:putative ABC transport system permease protein
VNVLRIATEGHNDEARDSVARESARTLRAAGIGVEAATSVRRSQVVTEAHHGPIVTIVLAIAVAMGVVGGIGLASTMSANVLDGIKEFGIMHAIGARPKAVRRIVVAEALFLALTSCLVAVVPTLVLTSVLGGGLGNLFLQAPLPFRVSLLAVAIWIAVALLGGALATDSGPTRASRITVREALSYL